MNSDNLPMIRKHGLFSKFIVRMKSFFGKKQYESKFNKADFFNIYEDIKNGDVSIEELDTEILEGLVKIANEEKKIKEDRLELLRQELKEAENRVMEG